MKWDDRIGRRLKLHDLHVLLTVAELGSMGKAAERLAVSQPSVSKAIADMEHTIGVRLLDRTPKGVEARPMAARCSGAAWARSTSCGRASRISSRSPIRPPARCGSDVPKRLLRD